MTKQIDQLMMLADAYAKAWHSSRLIVAYDAGDHRKALRQALNNWKQLSITELAAENHSVMEYCGHWEGRALKAEAALKPGEPVAKYIGECPDGSLLVQLFDDLKKGTELYTAATPAQTLCYCKDRAAQACPGEWEPGCDLGNNEAHAVAAQTPPPLLEEKEIVDLLGNCANGGWFKYHAFARAIETAVRKQFGIE